ncbi:MAG TPA: AraC family transcriptional regulator [Lachnospiraceae bacterium]|nr:AraC family transcriptional regulator [Lachnospiraceae bacterium]
MQTLIDLKDNLSENVSYNSKYPLYIRHGLLSLYPNYAAPSHWHDDVEFILILSGEMNYSINGETVQLKKDCGLFVNSRQLHAGFSANHTECSFICILLHPSLLKVHPDAENDYITPLVRNRRFPYTRLFADVKWQQEICCHLKSIYDSKDSPAALIRTLGYFALIWSILLENAPEYSETESVGDRDLAVFKKMLGFLHQNYNENITLSQIAASGFIGESKCCRLFRKYLKQTPNACLTDYRLLKGADLLKSTDDNVTQIALSTGFSGGSYFAETFRSRFGISPLEYRKREASKYSGA